MNFWQRLQFLWNLPTKPQETAEFKAGGPEIEEEEPIEAPFVSFPCGECKETIDVMSRIFPGQAVVVECDNCGASWTVHNPQLKVFRTKEAGKDIQNELWRQTSE